MVLSFLQSCSAVDVESTSPYPESCEIIELAFSIYGGDWQTFTQHYKPSIPVPPLSSEKHFINDNMLADKPSFATVKDGDFPVVVNAMEYFIAHNAKYDMTAIRNNYAMHNLEVPAKIADNDRWICTLKLARKLYANDQDMEAFRLTYLWFQLGLWQNYDRVLIPHQADSDIYMAGNLFKFLLEEMIRRGIIDTTAPIGPQVIAFQNEPVILASWPFGKHKGKALKDVPKDYLEWAIMNLSSLNEEHPDYDIDLGTTVMQEYASRQ